MQHRSELIFDSATALAQGQRARQEDCIACDFPQGTPLGFAVLADGMGGHASGDVASKLAVNEVFSGLKLWSDDPQAMERHLRDVLSDALDSANEAIAASAAMQPGSKDMGTTLLVPLVIDARLYWLSVGDSPLFLLRQRMLYRLNDEHSLASQLDAQVARGQLPAAKALSHPDRQCLTSVLTGAPVPEIDLRLTPVPLMEGDLLLAASDGVLSLGNKELQQILHRNRRQSARQICHALLAGIECSGVAEQDNTALCVVRVLPAQAASPTADRRPPQRRRVTLMAAGSAGSGVRCHQRLEEFSK